MSKVYKPDYRKVNEIMAKLQNTPGSSLSNADALNAVIKIGTNIGEALVKTKQHTLAADLTTALDNTTTAIKDLDWTQTGIEVEIPGEDEPVDLYDFKRKTAVDALDTLREQKDNRYINEHYGDSIDLLIRSNSAALAYQDTMQGQRAKNVEELTNLMTDYTNLVKSDPLLTGQGNYDAMIDIIDDIGKTQANLETQTSKKIIDQHLIPLTKIKREFNIISGLHDMDKNRTIEGIQVDLENEYSPYLKQFMRKTGLIAGEEVDGLTTLELPDTEIDLQSKLIPGEEYGDLSQLTEAERLEVIKQRREDTGLLRWLTENPERLVDEDGVPRISTSQYADASIAFQKWQELQMPLEVRNLAYAQTAEERRPLEIMRDWMEAPTDIAQSKGADTIAFQLFGDSDRTFLQSISHMEEGPYKDNLDEMYTALSILKAEGKHATAFEKMQTTYNQKQKAVSKLAGKTIGQIDEVNAAAIRSTSLATNNQLNIYNAQFKPGNPLRIPDVASFSGKDLARTTRESKVQHVESMNKLLKRANEGEWNKSTQPGGEIKLIRDYEDAKGEAKWIAIQKLVDTYLTPAGSRATENVDEVIAAFDADWMGGDREENEVELFYALLRSWQAVSNADSEGTTPIALLDLLSKQR